ncbi:hypothetical protein DXG01_001853 [Tephrocybe rancida]|nr:hypothetical protein DXG01_001853 [Tephrocybe rancida]
MSISVMVYAINSKYLHEKPKILEQDVGLALGQMLRKSQFKWPASKRCIEVKEEASRLEELFKFKRSSLSKDGDPEVAQTRPKQKQPRDVDNDDDIRHHRIGHRPPVGLLAAQALQLPLNAPTDVIRALLLQQSHTPELDSELDQLLQRLASFEVRSLYPRFGHNVITTCSYCHSFEDFGLYFLPRPIMSYIREVAFIGLIATSRRRAAVTSLFLMFVLECYILATVEIRVPPAGDPPPTLTIWWHDIILNIRRIIFILLPLIIHYTPTFRIPLISSPTPPPTVTTSAQLVQIHQAMTHLMPSLHLLKYGYAATMRVPELRARASAWWEEEAKVGAWIREDGAEGSDEGEARASVCSVARALGTSYDEGGEGVEEGKLRTSAKVMTKVLMIDGLKPTAHWQPLQG